jgi:hypothetical protein
MPPDPADVQRLIDDAEAQGYGRTVDDPETIARVAAIVRGARRDNGALSGAAADTFITSAGHDSSDRAASEGGGRRDRR